MAEQQLMLCRYHYDPLDRLNGLAPGGESDARLFYCKSRLTTRIQGALGHSFLRTEENLLAQQSASDTGMDTALLATDRQGSVLTPLKQAGQQALVYTAYGHHAPDSGLASLLGFNGQRRDPLTGHYLLGNGYRAYNPVLMRFNSPDSLSPFGAGGLNAYAYCQGDPVNYMDPSGHIIGPGYPSLIHKSGTGAWKRLVPFAKIPPTPRPSVPVARAFATPRPSAFDGEWAESMLIQEELAETLRLFRSRRPAIVAPLPPRRPMRVLGDSRIPRPSVPVAVASPTPSSSSSELELMSIRDPGVELLSERVIEVRRDGAQARRSFYRSDSSGTDGSD